MRTIVFTIPGIPSVLVTAFETGDGTITFNLEVQGEGDLRGFFFDVTGVDAEIVASGDNISTQDTDTLNLGQGVNLNGEAEDDFDIGVAFESAGDGQDVVSSTSFTLATTDGTPLTLDAIAHMEFGARLTGAGVEDSKITTVAPAAPDAIDDFVDAIEDTEITIDALGNDTDADGDALTITSVSDPANGTATIVDNKIVFLADENWSGTETITYSISDGDGGSDVATVTVDVEAVADAPEVSVEVMAGDNVQEVKLAITSALTDTDGSESLAIEISGLPEGVTLSGAVDGVIANPTGLDYVTLTLPEDMDFDFDVQIKAISTEASNGDMASTSVTQNVLFTHNVVETQVTLEANDKNQWGEGDEFTYDDDRTLDIFNFDTSKSGDIVKDALSYSLSYDMYTGLRSDLHFGGGEIDADVPYDLSFETSFNETTDVLVLNTSAFLADGGSFLTDGPELTYDLSLLYDFDADVSMTLDGPFDKTVSAGFDTGFKSLSLLSYDSDTDDGLTIELPKGFSGSLQWPNVEVSGTDSGSGLYEGSGKSENFLELGFDVDSFLFDPTNPFDLGVNFDIPVIGSGSASFELIDVDLFAGFNFEQDFQLEVGNLDAKLQFEDGTMQDFTFGDELTFTNASTLDANNDGDIDFNFILDVDDTMVTNDTDLGFNVGWNLDLLKGSYEYSVLVGIFNGEGGFGPLVNLGSGQVPVASADVYSDTFELDFEQQEYLLVA